MRHFAILKQRPEPIPLDTARPDLRPISNDEPPEEEWEVLHEIADDHRDPMREAFTAGVTSFVGRMTLAEIQREYEAGRIAGAVATLPWDQLETDLQEFQDIIIETIHQAGSAMVGFLPPNIQEAIHFDLLDPRSVEWIRSHTGDLIDEITDETRQAVRETIERAFEQGLHPRRTATHVRDIVGLTRRQARAVDNYRDRLRTQGVAWGRVEILSQRYAERLHRYRAENIARTETLRAANKGNHLVRLQARDQGLLQEGRTRRQWVVTPDDRLCDYCADMDGQTIPLDGQFDSAEYGPVDTPPLHPMCRCVDELVFDE